MSGRLRPVGAVAEGDHADGAERGEGDATGLPVLVCMPMATARDRRAAARVLRRLVEAVDRGEVTADTPQDRRYLRRIEGAIAALEADRATPRKKP